MARLQNITISTTLTCNEACAHCWVSAGPQPSDDLSSDEIRLVLEQAAGLGAEHVKLTGGEPLARGDLPALVVHAHELGMRVSIETNGLLLSERMLKSLSRRGTSPHLYVSIDGSSAATHDRFRMRKGALKRTVRNLERARDLGFYFSVHTVVRKQILDEVVEIHDLARRLGATQHKLILTLHNLGRARASRAESQLGLRQIFALLERLPSQEFWDYGWDPEPSRDTRLMTTLPPALQPAGAEVTTCGWSQSFLSVLANGSVALCHGLYDIEEAVAGNVRTDSLENIWQRSALFTSTRRWSGAALSGVCGNCKVRDSCRGLCRASAIGEYKDLKAPYPMCQALYEGGLFPEEMLVDANADSSYAAAA
jgi:radical SAM protein with 4Fe4S-binding SPASM domain